MTASLLSRNYVSKGSRSFQRGTVSLCRLKGAAKLRSVKLWGWYLCPSIILNQMCLSKNYKIVVWIVDLKSSLLRKLLLTAITAFIIFNWQNLAKMKISQTITHIRVILGPRDYYCCSKMTHLFWRSSRITSIHHNRNRLGWCDLRLHLRLRLM